MPPKPILKKGTESDGKKKKRVKVVWNEDNLNYNDAHRTAVMKIDEPKTPYNPNFSMEEAMRDEDSDSQTATSSAPGDHANGSNDKVVAADVLLSASNNDDTLVVVSDPFVPPAAGHSEPASDSALKQPVVSVARPISIDESDGAVGTPQGNAAGPPLDWSFLQSKVLDLKQEKERTGEDDWAPVKHEDQTKEDFLKHRKAHYNEFQMMKMMKAKLDDDADDDDDDDDDDDGATKQDNNSSK